jgi:hypothetical protein
VFNPPSISWLDPALQLATAIVAFVGFLAGTFLTHLMRVRRNNLATGRKFTALATALRAEIAANVSAHRATAESLDKLIYDYDDVPTPVSVDHTFSSVFNHAVKNLGILEDANTIDQIVRFYGVLPNEKDAEMGEKLVTDIKTPARRIVAFRIRQQMWQSTIKLGKRTIASLENLDRR